MARKFRHACNFLAWFAKLQGEPNCVCVLKNANFWSKYSLTTKTCIWMLLAAKAFVRSKISLGKDLILECCRRRTGYVSRARGLSVPQSLWRQVWNFDKLVQRYITCLLTYRPGRELVLQSYTWCFVRSHAAARAWSSTCKTGQILNRRTLCKKVLIILHETHWFCFFSFFFAAWKLLRWNNVYKSKSSEVCIDYMLLWSMYF